MPVPDPIDRALAAWEQRHRIDLPPLARAELRGMLAMCPPQPDSQAPQALFQAQTPHPPTGHDAAEAPPTPQDPSAWIADLAERLSLPILAASIIGRDETFLGGLRGIPAEELDLLTNRASIVGHALRERMEARRAGRRGVR
jgi:hypothetical protein